MPSKRSTTADVRQYRLKVAGLLDEEFVRQFCPPDLRIDRAAGCTHLSNIQLDQAGLIGLLRQLHNLNCLMLSITGEEHDHDDTINDL